MDDLNERAMVLMGWRIGPCGCGPMGEQYEHWQKEGRVCRVFMQDFSTDLNDVVELFQAAPKAVQIAVADRVRDLWLGTILDPTALTRAVVEAWEAHNAKGGDDEQVDAAMQAMDHGPPCPECARLRERVAELEREVKSQLAWLHEADRIIPELRMKVARLETALKQTAPPTGE